MKKIAFILITVLLFGVGTIKSQDQILNDSEPISSGCLNQSNRSYGDEASGLPTIKLTKEGSILSVDLLNYESNCATTGFDMESRLYSGNDDTPSVVISVVPIIPTQANCFCPFNISYTVRDFENNKFLLTCWWFEGPVELTEGEPLVLEYKTQNAVIDDLKYLLLKTSHQAKLLSQDAWDDETEILQIPSEVEYEGEQYTVTSIDESVFKSNNTITQIVIPKTIKNSEFGSMDGITSNPFSNCLSLETIEVDEENPVICSIDGILFNKDITTLIGYPAASPRELYTVPDNVKRTANGAFVNSQHLKNVVLPDNMETLGAGLFKNSNSLEKAVLPLNIKELPTYLFKDCIKLKSVVIPGDVETIGNFVFEGCSSLESISIPESVVTIGMGAFNGCTSLKSVTLSPNLGVIPRSMFTDCSNLTEVIIPFGITSIGSAAFGGCTAMQSVDLPESITFIDYYAFRHISNLKDFYCRATAVPNTRNNIFYNTDLSQATLHVPAASVDAYKAAEPWKDFNEIVALPDQNDYYYYQGNKIPLTLNEYKVVVSIPKDRGDIIERVKANIQTLGIIKDTTFDIYVVQRSEYDKLISLDFWSEDAKSVILTSSYIIESNEEVYATPYLNVRLKKEEDIALLTSYADQYKLTIVNNSPLMPLWYILAITPESKKNNLVCANELYESGDFAASTPDLAEGYSPQIAYRPFVEDGKVWKVGVVNTGNPVQVVEYYYFDGDTIIDGKTCKQMMCQRYVNPEYAVNHNISQDNSLSYVGAWYEEDKKVYTYDSLDHHFKLMYDFSADANDILHINNQIYMIGPRQMGGLKGFKGVYREVRMCAEEGFINSVPWLEGVGGTDGPTINVYAGYVEPLWVLMSCTVGDEVIYFNDEYEDGATPEDMEAQKRRFDFTHTTKLQPKIPTRREEEQTIYGEYNDFQLDINLEPIDDTYLVSITDASGKVVYEKTINAGNIVGLNIDIFNYPKGLYTVTVENSLEVFTGEFETQATGIEEVRYKKEDVKSDIFNLQGQRISSLQKGLNIVNGQKVFVK